jgi:hypothetical protein
LKSQYQAEVATICLQLAVLGTQLQSFNSLAPALQPLIAGIEALTQGDPAITPLLAVLQGTASSVPTVASLVARMVLLDQLLSRLKLIDPAAAHRLARALPALHALVAGLVQAATDSGVLPGSALTDPLAPTQVLQPALAVLGTDAALAGGEGPTATAQATGLTLADRAQDTVRRHSDHARAADVSTPAPAAVRQVAPIPSAPLGGGVLGSASGGLGSAAPAAVALLAVLAVWLLDTLLSGRIALDLIPRRTALLALRQERPG